MKAILIISSFVVVNSVYGASVKNLNALNKKSLYSDSFKSVQNDFKEYSNIYQYCRADYLDFNTYKPLENSELISVQAIFRHGDRAPTYFNVDDGNTWSLCDKTSLAKQLRPMTTIQLDDASIDITKGQVLQIPYNPVCIAGELTQKGAIDSIDLGKSMREVYVKKLGFLKPDLQNASQLKVRTSNSMRARQTANYVLSGLYPFTGNGDDVVVNSFYLPAATDNIFDNLSACPKSRVLYNKMAESDDFQEYLGMNKDYIDIMNPMIAANKSTLAFTSSRAYYLDSIQGRKCHGLPYACNKVGKCVNDDMYNTFTSDYTWETYFQKRLSPLSEEYNKLTAGLYLRDFKRDMEELVKLNKNRKKCPNKKSPRFYMYSAHDQTNHFVAYSLKAGVLDSLAAPFSSNMYFEVWKNNTNRKLSIRAFYNNRILQVYGKDGSRTNPWCDFNSCDYDTFMKFLDTVIPKNPSAECSA
ncbi:putative acid phosphatase [Smittium culicis]|uniref:Putative acid phosphatase n=1 Tax=Smittium culicis TaxID=133412 RepID=A0A1R1Y1G0_9FUNG|nr:putative acid phosphatase [Smittium culicis]